MMKFIRALRAIPFNDTIYLEGTVVVGTEEQLTPLVEQGAGIWCDDPTPPEPEPTSEPIETAQP